MKHKKKFPSILIAIALLIIILTVSGGIYLNDYYHALPESLKSLEQQDDGITVRVDETTDRIIFAPEEPTSGIIFYPGGKVQYESYAPLMRKLAEKGILSVLVKMPGNLAVLDVNAADGIREEFPEVERWYMAGHSLGGSMAASYLSKHSDDFSGLILLAAYSTADLSQESREMEGTVPAVLSVYGSEDGVLNMEKYEKYRSNIPQMEEVILEGGNHAGFGGYGEQEGDNAAQINAEQQQQETADLIAEWIYQQ